MMRPPGMGPPGAMPPPGLGMAPPGMGMPQPMHLPGMPPRPGQMQGPPGYRPPQSKFSCTLSVSEILFTLCLLPVVWTSGCMTSVGECTEAQVWVRPTGSTDHAALGVCPGELLLICRVKSHLKQCTDKAWSCSFCAQMGCF